jgi:hypothetical protein
LITIKAVLGSLFGGVADGGVNKAVVLRFLCFRAAAFFSLFAFCRSVRTLVLRFGFGFALALVFRLGLAAFFFAADFFVVADWVAAEVALVVGEAVFLFDAVARPVCALGLPGRFAGAPVA